MPKEPIQAPYDTHGNLLHFPGYSYHSTQPEWRDVVPFDATLTFNGQHRGRSAAYFEWLDADGRKWPMFMTDIGDLLQAATIDLGVVSARWTVQKRGQNYGVRLATDRDV